MTKARRHVPALPMDVLFDDPRFVVMTPAARGMAWNLVWHFWLSECAPLPKDDDRLFVLAQAHRPTWRNYKPAILAILADALPELHKRRERSRAQSLHLQRLGNKGASSTALKALRKSAPLVDVAAPIAPTTRQTPKQAPAPMPRESGGFVDRIRR